MGHITDEHVAGINDRIAQATTTMRAFDILGVCTRTMIDRLLDLNGVDVTSLKGYGIEARRERVAEAHGWDWNERGDDRPADGYGRCDLPGFEAHSRRPLECRRCGRRKIDHRELTIVAHPPTWPGYIDNR